jgi:hypothetical protein
MHTRKKEEPGLCGARILSYRPLMHSSSGRWLWHSSKDRLTWCLNLQQQVENLLLRFSRVKLKVHGSIENEAAGATVTRSTLELSK